MSSKILGQISANVLGSLGKYQQMGKDIRANVSRRAKICCGQISAYVQRYVGKYQQTCKNLLENIRRRVNICGQISEDMRRFKRKYLWANTADVGRSFGKYQKKCKDLLWANISEDLWAIISRCAKICGQISADVGRSFGKYQKTCKDLR